MLVKYAGKTHNLEIVSDPNLVPTIKGTLFPGGLCADLWNKCRNNIVILNISDKEKDSFPMLF